MGYHSNIKRHRREDARRAEYERRSAMTQEQRDAEDKANAERWEELCQRLYGCSSEEHSRKEQEKYNKKKAAKEAKEARDLLISRGEVVIKVEDLLKRDSSCMRAVNSYLVSVGLVSKYSIPSYPSANTFDMMKIMSIRKRVLSRKTTEGHITKEEGLELVKEFLASKGVTV